MRTAIDKLGKVAVTVEKDYWSNKKTYDKLTIVEKKGVFGTYISRKAVPAGIDITNREYWIPFSSLKEEIVLKFNELVSGVDNLKTTVDEKEAELYNAIASIIVGGVALKQSLGNSEVFGISQKKITEEFADVRQKTAADDATLQAQITDNDTHIRNIADEEDVTMVSIDERPAIKLKDKTYEPEKYSGLGRKYLRKNIIYDVNIVHFGGFVENVAIQEVGAAITDGNSSNVVYDRIRKAFLYKEKKDLRTPIKYYDVWTSEEVPYSDYYQSSFSEGYIIRTDVVFMVGDVPYRWDENDQELAVWSDFYESHSKNILTQAMINNPNTIYHIQYDYDLNGQTITVPEGCTLEFNGGSLRNGTLVGDFAVVKAISTEVFHNVTLPVSVESIDKEVDDLKAMDNDLSGRITEEANRAMGSETNLQQGISSLDSRLQQVEGLAELSVEGGQIGIAAATDFTNRTTEGDLKIPTVGAILNAADEEPTAGSNNLVKSGGVKNELALGAVYDVSAKNPTAGPNNDGKWESLSALLSDANLNTLIPLAARKGGMSIKFVQSSDNKYVQYRLMTDSWSTDTKDWAIAEEGVYVENPEFVYVKTDKDDKVLWAIKTDGSIYYGTGVPQQVIDYIEEKLANYSPDEYEDIVAFLNGLEEGDKTLQTLLNEKVDKVEGKSLIDAEYASSQSAIESPEFLEVTTDSEDKVLEGIQQDGTKVIGGDLIVRGSAKILGEMEVAGTIYKVVENPEYLAAWVDAEDKIIFGLKADGKTYVGDADFLNDIDNIKAFLQNITDKNIDWDALLSITAVENPEFIEIKTDLEGKLLAGRTPDGSAFENVGFSTPKMSIDGHIIENTEDPEERSEITTDAEGKIISYRDNDGVKHENVGIHTKQIIADSIILPEDAVNQVNEIINKHIPQKQWYLPSFGIVNIKEETFYLTSNSRYSDKTGVVLIQMLDNTGINAQQKLTLSYYYVKSSLIPLEDGTYDRTSVTNDSIKLNFYRQEEVSEVNSKYYVKSTLVDGAVVDTSIEVTQIKDVPPYKAWTVDKEEHYCIADIDFGTFYNKENVPVGIKYQGNNTMMHVKRGFRLTFYKNSTYKKKDKVKLGEMLRLSGYNMKSYQGDKSRISDPITSVLFTEIWETRGDKSYPWNSYSPYCGATGFIKSFPIATYFGKEFFGLQMFGLKKDEKNYMLDGDNDNSGIFCSGEIHGNWADASPRNWADEMGVDGRDLAYPDLGDDSVSVATAEAMSEFFKYTKGFVDGTIEINGEIVEFTNSMLEERIDLASWIDYWVCCQVFQLWDNTFHNVILYSGSDKRKFYLFFYDLDHNLEYSYNMDVIEHNVSENIPMDFWVKFIEEYKDQIVNRYSRLRKTVLTSDNVYSIYRKIIDSIPEDSLSKEQSTWGGIPSDYESKISLLKNRLEWLDKTYFNIDKFNN